MFYCMVVLRFPTMLIATEVICFGGFCLTPSLFFIENFVLIKYLKNFMNFFL